MLNNDVFKPHKNIFFDFSNFCCFLAWPQKPYVLELRPVMKTKGGITYIGVSMEELKKYFTDDAVIHVSKKFLNSFQMISGMEEEVKPISLNVTEKTEKIEVTNEVKPEVLPPVELNVNGGDW